MKIVLAMLMILAGVVAIAPRSFAQLNQHDNPGVGIGDDQSTADPEYFDGAIEQVRLYNAPDPLPTPASITLGRVKVIGGDNVKISVQIDDAPFVRTNVTLHSDNPAVTVQAAEGVDAGFTSTPTFVIHTQPVTATQIAHITATLNGSTISRKLTVEP